MAEFSRTHRRALSCASAIALAISTGSAAHAQTTAPAPENQIVVTGNPAYGADPAFRQKPAALPVGDIDVLNLPLSVTTVPEELIVDAMPRTVNDILRYLPSVQIRDQQGLEVSRPQSRGFMGSVVQSTRMDGLSIIGTSALPAENLEGIQVLNGMAGGMYGPQPPAGVFDYQLKRPTDTPLFRAIGSFESNAMWTGQIDAGGRSGAIGWRLNVLHGEGEGYTSGSHLDRSMVAGDFDIHVDRNTVIEIDALHYQTQAYGLAGQITYAQAPTLSGFTIPASYKASTTANSIPLPAAFDPSTPGYGQSYGGSDLNTNMALMKVKRDLGNGWKLEIGGLYQNANRGVFGIQDDLINAKGDYVVVKNYSSAPRFTILSNLISLTGSVKLLGIRNDLMIGTNGFSNSQYSGLVPGANGTTVKDSTYVDGTKASPNCSTAGAYGVVLGYGNLNSPTVLTNVCPTVSPTSSGMYRSGLTFVQTLVLNDAIHLTDRFTLGAGLGISWLHTKTYSYVAATGTTQAGLALSGTPLYNSGEMSPTVSVTYKPVPPLTLYATYASAVEQGSQAPATGVANPNAFLSPIRDHEAEAGIKYQFAPGFLLTADGFRMTQAYAGDSSDAVPVYEYIGKQRNWGAELFGAGTLSPAVSLFGGVTYLDARLLAEGASLPAGTDGKLIIGVPHWKSDVTLDLHPRAAHGLAFIGTVHYESDRAANNTNTFSAPSYATVDLGLRYSAALWRHHETLRFNVTNVTDTFYWSSIADGSAIGANGADTAFAGAPRTFLASIEMDY